MLWKELRIGTLLCLTLGTVVFGLTVTFWYFTDNKPFDPTVSLAISAAVGAHIVTAALFGSMIPLMFSRMGWQPEVFSHPALNCVADTAGTAIYLAVLILALAPAG